MSPMQWTVPRMWEGQTIAVLASGPSMSQEVCDLVHRTPGVQAIAINETWRLAPWATMLYAADPEWWTFHGNRALREFRGLKVSCMPVNGVLQLRNSGTEGFDPDPSAVRTGGNSGYQALHIAAHAGAARVLLCGFDMRGGADHWHGRHPHPLKQTDDEQFARWIRRFGTLAPVLAKRGVDVVNCTPGSALQCFRMGVLEDELARTEPAAPLAALSA